MAPGERFPEKDSDRPDVRGSVRLATCEALGSNIGEGSGYVARRGEGLGLLELRETEVEEADGQLLAVLDHDVSRLHVPVEDLLAVRMGEGVEHLGPHLDRGGVVELAAS
jgi:hypothetical protein